MNEFDPLEAELAALKPVEPSPHLRQRIAGELVTSAPVRSQGTRTWWRGAISGSLVAAALVIGLLLLRPMPKQIQRELPQAPPEIDAAAFDPALPTVWNYQRALARSPQDLEMLLDKHAAAASSRTAAAPRHLFIQSDANLFFQGEL